MVCNLFYLYASGVDGCGLEGFNKSTTMSETGAHLQGKLGSRILLGDLQLVLWLCKLELLVRVEIAVMIVLGMSFVSNSS